MYRIHKYDTPNKFTCVTCACRDALVCLAVFAISLAASVAIVDTTAERLGLDSNEMGQGCITALFKWLESRSMTGSVLTLPERVGIS